MQQRAQIKSHAVVEDRLPDKQRHPKDRAPRIELECHPGDLRERNRLALTNLQRPALRLGELFAGFPLYFFFYLPDDPLGFLVAPMNEQPPRTFRNVAPHNKNDEAEYGANPKGEPPSDVCRED